VKWFEKWITNRAEKIAYKQMEEKEMNYINQSPK
jgi:hypothetical protein